MSAEWFGDPAYLGDYFNIWPTTPGEWEHTAEQKTTPRSGVFVIVHRELAEAAGMQREGLCRGISFLDEHDFDMSQCAAKGGDRCDGRPAARVPFPNVASRHQRAVQS
jgi:hypothetical protein